MIKRYTFLAFIFLKLGTLTAMERVLSLQELATGTIIKEKTHQHPSHKNDAFEQLSILLPEFTNSKITREHLGSFLKTLTPQKTISLSGHEKRITCVALSHWGDYALTGSADNTVRLWDTNSGVCLQLFRGHTSPITALAFYPRLEKRLIASASDDGSVCIWDIAQGTCIYTTNVFQQLKLTKDNDRPDLCYLSHLHFHNSTLTIGMPHITVFFDLVDKKLKSPQDTLLLNLASTRYTIAPTSGSILFANQSAMNVLNKKDSSLKTKLEGTAGKLLCAQMSLDQRLVIAGSLEGVVKIWDIETGTCLHTFNDQTGPITAVNFSADTLYAITVQCFSTFFKLVRWNLTTGKKITIVTQPCNGKNPLLVYYVPNNDEHSYYIQYHDGTGTLIPKNYQSMPTYSSTLLTPDYHCYIGDSTLLISSPNKMYTHTLDHQNKQITISTVAYRHDRTIKALIGYSDTTAELWTLLPDFSIAERIALLHGEQHHIFNHKNKSINTLVS